MSKKNAVERKSWKEFRESGLLWFVNRTLHLFGWSIVISIKDGEIDEIYPAKVVFRGFSEQVEEEGFKALSKHIKENIDDIVEDTVEIPEK